MFFSVKTHKPDMPFRCIVSERECWQQNVSCYLLKHLSALDVDDPFTVTNSTDVTQYLQNLESGGSACSLDVEDLFYSVPHAELFPIGRACIEQNGVLAFERGAGISVDNFMTLLEFYLCSALVSYDGRVYIQRKGICIGSCVAPVLCNIFLSAIDRDLACVFDDAKVQKVFRYVDDFLVILKPIPFCNDH